MRKENQMAKIIDKVAAVVHYVDGRTDDGYFELPVRVGGQYPQHYATLMKGDEVEVLVNLFHAISIEQKIIFKE